MVKTTIYLPDDLKTSLERVAREESRSEAEIIRDSLRSTLAQRGRPRPRIPLTDRGLGDATVAENIDRHLRGFGSE